MNKLGLFAIAMWSATAAQAAESPFEWGPWGVDREQAPLSGYDVEEYDQGVMHQIPMASDLENSFQPVGLAESALNDVGGTINDIIEGVLEQNPGASIDDIVSNLPGDLGGVGSDIGGVVDDVVDALP